MSGREDSNLRPHGPEPCTLNQAELRPERVCFVGDAGILESRWCVNVSLAGIVGI
jgi:hypothetical protein